MHKNNTGKTSFQLNFSTKIVIPLEITLPSFKVAHFEGGNNDGKKSANLYLIKEQKVKATMKKERYERKAARYYNQRVHNRQYQIEDLVLKRLEVAGYVPRKFDPT